MAKMGRLSQRIRIAARPSETRQRTSAASAERFKTPSILRRDTRHTSSPPLVDLHQVRPRSARLRFGRVQVELVCNVAKSWSIF